MGLEKLKDWVPRIVLKLIEKPQLAEQGTLNIGGHHTHYHLTLSKEFTKEDLSALITNHLDQISQMVAEKLEADKTHLATLPEQEQFQFIVNSTTASIDAVLVQGELGFKGDVKWKKLTDPSNKDKY